jgi:hypothetical protein
MAYSPSRQWAQPVTVEEYITEGQSLTHRELEQLRCTPEFLQWQQQKERQRNMITRAYGAHFILLQA